MNRSLVIIGIACLLAGIFTIKLFLFLPPVWPDEAIFADIARNVITTHSFHTDLWGSSIPGALTCACWYPPLFFYLLAVWLHVTGFGIIQQRLLSVFAGVGFLLVFYIFFQQILKTKKLPVSQLQWKSALIFSAFIINFHFLAAVKISRPEIFVLFTGMISLISFQKSIHKRESGYSGALSGIFAAVSLLLHIMGIFILFTQISYFIVCRTWREVSLKTVFSYLFSFLVISTGWVLLNMHRFSFISQQMALSFQRKQFIHGITLFSSFQSPGIESIEILLYISITVLFFIVTLERMLVHESEDRSSVFVSLLLLFSWVFAVMVKESWYIIFPIPFVYLALALLWNNAMSYTKRSFQIGIPAVCYLLIFFSLWSQFSTLLFLHRYPNGYSYRAFEKTLQMNIPDNTAVFLSSIPDGYFAFQKRHYILYKFPDVPISREQYLTLLKKSDYIVFNGVFDVDMYGNFLSRYIQANYMSIKRIRTTGQFQVDIIQLQSRNNRKIPLQSDIPFHF